MKVVKITTKKEKMMNILKENRRVYVTFKGQLGSVVKSGIVGEEVIVRFNPSVFLCIRISKLSIIGDSQDANDFILNLKNS